MTHFHFNLFLFILLQQNHQKVLILSPQLSLYDVLWLVLVQSWRATLIPVVAVPISLIGTFGFMLIFGFSLNILTLLGLKQDILQRMLLPMGEMTKPEARAYAAGRGFEKVSKKKDSIGVCFCPLDYRSFLKKHFCNAGGDRSNKIIREVGKGRFLDESGNFIAWHEGYPFYTIGQRRGLGIQLNRAVFVKEIHPETNEVILAPLKSLEKSEMWLKDWNIINESRLLGYDDIIVRIRYRKQENHCSVTITPEGLLHIQLHEPLSAIAEGQAAAFYRDGLLLGGGIITMNDER